MAKSSKKKFHTVRAPKSYLFILHRSVAVEAEVQSDQSSFTQFASKIDKRTLVFKQEKYALCRF